MCPSGHYGAWTRVCGNKGNWLDADDYCARISLDDLVLKAAVLEHNADLSPTALFTILADYIRYVFIGV